MFDYYGETTFKAGDPVYFDKKFVGIAAGPVTPAPKPLFDRGDVVTGDDLPGPWMVIEPVNDNLVWVLTGNRVGSFMDAVGRKAIERKLVSVRGLSPWKVALVAERGRINIGDVVRLKDMIGPAMSVQEVLDPPAVRCAWWDEDRHVQFAEFHPDSLEHVAPATAAPAEKPAPVQLKLKPAAEWKKVD